MERKIGDPFEFEGKKLQVKESASNGCDGCFFYMKCSSITMGLSGECEVDARDDGKDVIFVEVQEQPQETEEIKERKVGEVFEYQGKKLKVVETADNLCFGCYFFDGVNCQRTEREGGECSNLKRADYKPVIFVEVHEHPQELNLCEILRDCPKGTKFYSTVFGDVRFKEIVDAVYPIVVSCKDKHAECFSADGKVMIKYDGECCIFPSKEMRDWSKFTAPWLKKERFDPKILKPFDKVLVRFDCGVWSATLFSHLIDSKFANKKYDIICCGSVFGYCIPYNDDTKHLVGTKDDAPDFYRYWED